MAFNYGCDLTHILQLRKLEKNAWSKRKNFSLHIEYNFKREPAYAGQFLAPAKAFCFKITDFIFGF